MLLVQPGSGRAALLQQRNFIRMRVGTERSEENSMCLRPCKWADSSSYRLKLRKLENEGFGEKRDGLEQTSQEETDAWRRI